jgi:hypothetical protein
MERRDFLWLLGAASIAPSRLFAAPPPAGATILYNDRTIVLDHVGPNRADSPGALWIRKVDLPRVNEFEVKPQGACRADVCIPIPKTMVRGAYFNLTAFARRAGQMAVADPGARVWSFGEIPVVRGSFLESRMAPDFGVPDRTGRLVHLSDSKGKKVLLVTWASW